MKLSALHYILSHCRHSSVRQWALWLTLLVSVQFNNSMMSDSLWPHELQHTRLPFHCQLPEPAQTHIHQVGDAIQPSHPLSSPSPAFSISQHQGLSQWISSLYQVAKVLELQLQHQSLQWIFRTDFLYDWLVGSLWSPRDSQESSPSPKFKSINFSALGFLYDPYMTTEKNHSID